MAQAVVAPTTTVSSLTWTVAEVERMSPSFRCEIIEGVLYMTPMPLWPHPRVVMRLIRVLDAWVQDHALGEVMAPQTGIYISETRYLDPDVLYLRPDQAPRVGERCTAAALAAEVMSPSNLRAPREQREKLLARAGVEELWYVDAAARTLEVRRLGRSRYDTIAVFRECEVVTSEIFPGLQFPLSALWQGTDEGGGA